LVFSEIILSWIPSLTLGWSWVDERKIRAVFQGVFVGILLLNSFYYDTFLRILVLCSYILAEFLVIRASWIEKIELKPLFEEPVKPEDTDESRAWAVRLTLYIVISIMITRILFPSSWSTYFAASTLYNIILFSITGALVSYLIYGLAQYLGASVPVLRLVFAASYSAFLPIIAWINLIGYFYGSGFQLASLWAIQFALISLLHPAISEKLVDRVVASRPAMYTEKFISHPGTAAAAWVLVALPVSIVFVSGWLRLGFVLEWPQVPLMETIRVFFTSWFLLSIVGIISALSRKLGVVPSNKYISDYARLIGQTGKSRSMFGIIKKLEYLSQKLLRIWRILFLVF
jgi:hypothetical protein